MSQVAFLYNDISIYWSSVILALAVATGILFFLAASFRTYGSIAAAVIACPVMILLSLLFSRFLHWYFLADSYESIAEAMTNFKSTGYVLLGVFAACMLTACVFRLTGIVENLPAFLDCMSIGGCAAIALGRLSFFFTVSDRGDILTNMTELPWASAIVNTTSGAVEFRFATFLVQAIVVGVIFAVIFWQFFRRHKDGDVTMLLLLLYCASQAVLDSTRYDAVRLRSNGFISVVQVVSALCLVAVIVTLSIRLIKMNGFKIWYMILWCLSAAGIGGAAYMEYYVQRHGGKALFAYSVMSGCLMVTVIAGITLLCLTNRPKRHFLKA